LFKSFRSKQTSSEPLRLRFLAPLATHILSVNTHANIHPSGVAVGSSIGHAVGGWFSGGSSSEAPAAQQAASTDFAQQHSQVNMSSQGGACQAQIGDFRKCMDDNQGSLNICGWYLDQLKACQAAASQY
jgi:hypothetical protein